MSKAEGEDSIRSLLSLGLLEVGAQRNTLYNMRFGRAAKVALGSGDALISVVDEGGNVGERALSTL
jgi:hypothetical protein